jgi:predicted phage terminase large subunit-like protein
VPSQPSPFADPREASRWARCELARRTLADFCGLIEIPGAPIGDDDASETFQPIRAPQALHHQLLNGKLEEVEAGTLRRLMVFMPPGSAKSTYASVVFPVWFMGRTRRRNVIVATYASDLARKIGRRARSILKQPVYREVFNTGLSADSSAADEWALDNENEFMGGGILSGITGNRADLIVIDDPIKGRAEADSETIRARTRAEYDDSIKTRLKPGGRIVLIQTRWHEDDLAGQLLPEDYDGQTGWVEGRDGERWYVISIPAQAERLDDPLGRRPGEYLWPEWFDEAHWRSFRANARTWSALYQQRPQPDEGTYFQRDWFKRYELDQLPKALRVYGTSDYAVTEDGGDFTVHRRWGVDATGDIWLLPGGYRAQSTTDKWIEAVIDQMMLSPRPMAWFGEAGVIQKAVEPALLRRMKERNVPCRLEWLPSINDKPTRARGFQARAAMGTVHFPAGPEGDAILGEYLRFPAGRNDDDVDAGSMIGRALDMAHPAVVRPDPAPKDPTPRGIRQATFAEIMARQPRMERV